MASEINSKMEMVSLDTNSPKENETIFNNISNITKDDFLSVDLQKVTPRSSISIFGENKPAKYDMLAAANNILKFVTENSFFLSLKNEENREQLINFRNKITLLMNNVRDSKKPEKREAEETLIKARNIVNGILEVQPQDANNEKTNKIIFDNISNITPDTFLSINLQTVTPRSSISIFSAKNYDKYKTADSIYHFVKNNETFLKKQDKEKLERFQRSISSLKDSIITSKDKEKAIAAAGLLSRAYMEVDAILEPLQKKETDLSAKNEIPVMSLKNPDESNPYDDISYDAIEIDSRLNPDDIR